MATLLLVSKVLMPEKGLFTVRVDEALVQSGSVKAGAKGRFIVSLDYGEDVGTVIETAPYDPAVHGERVPGFRLVRPFASQDEAALAENATRAEEMRIAFLSAIRETLPNLRIPCARLSFGRHRLFLRYVCEQSHPNFSAAQDVLKRRFGVELSLWAMGPLGPCGRVCCCSSWQRRYPSHLAPDRRNAMPALMNGTCGRFKCCLAFERETSAGGPSCEASPA